MRKLLILIYIIACSSVSYADMYCTDYDDTYMSGLVAHYFKDKDHWGGHWNTTNSLPDNGVIAENYTFSEYRYSRIEPVVNHLFVKRGWFSVRWVGYLDTTVRYSDTTATSKIMADIIIPLTNIQFNVTLNDGHVISQNDFKKNNIIKGVAKRIFIRPLCKELKTVKVDDYLYPVKLGESFELFGEEINFSIVKSINSANPVLHIMFYAKKASIFPLSSKIISDIGKKTLDGISKHDYIFEMLADDGCRLFVDGKMIIDGWYPCWEGSYNAVRRSSTIMLSEGLHRIDIEYFQGQSLEDGDADPVRLYWSSNLQSVPRQIIRPSHFFYTLKETRTYDR